jgi:hypothetical protein
LIGAWNIYLRGKAIKYELRLFISEQDGDCPKLLERSNKFDSTFCFIQRVDGGMQRIATPKRAERRSADACDGYGGAAG